MTITLSLAQLAAVIITLAALLAAIGYLLRKGRDLVRVVHALHTVVERELTNNHGSSMKDDLDGLAVGYGVVARQVDGIQDQVSDLDDRLTTHLDERRAP